MPTPTLFRLQTTALCLLVGALPTIGQQATPPPFTERVNVQLRSILIVATDKAGKHLNKPPAPTDLAISENGTRVEIAGIEPASATSPSTTASQATTPPSEAPRGLPQYLYLDTALLQRQSPREIIDAFLHHLPAVLNIGTLEVILADPQPTTLLPASTDAGQIRSVLSGLRKQLTGKEALLALRRQTLQQMRQDPGRRMQAQLALQEELQTLQDRWRRLETWASSPAVTPPAVLYLANDGFDLDVADVYASALSFREAVELRTQFATRLPVMVAALARTLATNGLLTNPIAVGGNVPEFAGSAANVGKVKLENMTRSATAPTFLFSRPLDGLRIISDVTGGTLVNGDRLTDALNRLANVYRVFYRSNAPPNGKPRGIDVQSRHADLSVRAPGYASTGTPEATAAERAYRALNGAPPEPGADLPVTITITDVTTLKKQRAGRLHVSADLSSILTALQRTGNPRIRVTIVVEITGAEPFVTHQELDVTPTEGGTQWQFEAPIQWPPDAQRVAVTLEELRTGTFGVGATTLPRQ
ncbi:MAG: hypothetical protein M3167_00360 [Acidobacteriota bacterium]|nr:hypothetical protein [Acidobacteriota bacterium]